GWRRPRRSSRRRRRAWRSRPPAAPSWYETWGDHGTASAARQAGPLVAQQKLKDGSGEETMFYDAAKRDHGLAQDPLKSLIVPRPIGWISTVDGQGRVNLAPYSFYNAVSEF